MAHLIINLVRLLFSQLCRLNTGSDMNAASPLISGIHLPKSASACLARCIAPKSRQVLGASGCLVSLDGAFQKMDVSSLIPNKAVPFTKVSAPVFMPSLCESSSAKAGMPGAMILRKRMGAVAFIGPLQPS